jgi:hypothetical protein
MSEGRAITGSRWWFTILAFLAGIAVHAAASGHRPPVVAEPRPAVVTPAPDGGGGVALADADADTCGVQQD